MLRLFSLIKLYLIFQDKRNQLWLFWWWDAGIEILNKIKFKKMTEGEIKMG